MDKLTKGWVQHLRNTARQETSNRGYQCPLCEAEVQPDIDAFKDHVRADSARHAALAEDADIEEAFKNFTLHGNDGIKHQSQDADRAFRGRSSGLASRKRPVSGNPDAMNKAEDESDTLNVPSDQTESSQRGSKKLCSPPASITQQRGSSPPTPSRSRARPNDGMSDFSRGHSQNNPAGRQLWTPDDDRRAHPQRPKASQTRHGQASAPSNHRHSPQHKNRRRHFQHDLPAPSSDELPPSEMIRQPDTRPISPDQLVAEVKGIYAGLVILESKCIEYDSSQQSADLSEEQYHALISLHRSVLHEHHDFFLASQHPSASDALRRLALKYAMPARMWRHGIHSFLELLRHKLPESLEHMLTFIYIAYSMMALLYETVPAFEDTWIECLGDLGRYRMAIEDDDIRDREIWTGVARYWYARASDKAPTTGRLYHHLAILSRPNALQQLYFYAKSLCVPIPFTSAKESVMTLFEPLLNPNMAPHQRLEPADAAFVRVHGILFSGKAEDQLQPSMDRFLELLGGRIAREQGDWLESGYHVGISLSCLLLEFGNESNVLIRAIPKPGPADKAVAPTKKGTAVHPSPAFNKAVTFAARTYEIVMNQWGDKATLPCLHTTLAFMLFMSNHPAAMKHLEWHFPWKRLSLLLNHMLDNCEYETRFDKEAFPGPEKNEAPYPLPEDYAMRGLIYTETYFPLNWFSNENIDDDEKYFERGSTVGKRQERILWIGHKIAEVEQWLLWDGEEQKFSVTSDYDISLPDFPETAGIDNKDDETLPQEV